MKKNKNIIFIIIAIIVIILLLVVIKEKNNNKDNVASKTYTYVGEGFGGDFTITINDDGTASFYEGNLSSYIGEGTWSIENDILYLNDNTFKNKFKINGNELVFIENGSMNFPYVKVKDGEKFINESLE